MEEKEGRVYRRRMKKEEYEGGKQSMWMPKTPGKATGAGRSQLAMVAADDGVSCSGSGCCLQIFDFDVSKTVCEYDDVQGFVGFAYMMDSGEKEKKDGNNGEDDQALTFSEELLYTGLVEKVEQCMNAGFDIDVEKLPEELKHINLEKPPEELIDINVEKLPEETKPVDMDVEKPLEETKPVDFNVEKLPGEESEAIGDMQPQSQIEEPPIGNIPSENPIADDSMSQSKFDASYIPSSSSEKDDGKFNSTSGPSKKKNLKRKTDEGSSLNQRAKKKLKKTVHRPKVVGFGRARVPKPPMEPKTPKKRAPKPKRAPPTPKPPKKEKTPRKKKASRKLKNSVSFSIDDDDQNDLYVPERENHMSIDLNSEPKKEEDENQSAIILVVTSPKRVRDCRHKSMNNNANIVLKFPDMFRKLRMARRRCGLERMLFIASMFRESSHDTIDQLNEALQSLFKIKKKRSQRWRWRHKQNINVPASAPAPDLTAKFSNDLISDAQPPPNNHGHGVLVPYEGKRQNQATNSGLEMVATTSNGGGMEIVAARPIGKINKRLAKLSEDERELVVSWKLGIQGKAAEAKKKADDEEWMRNEREVLFKRVMLLISRMHLIQGDRTFVEWKGSVVDSIVGVFLTQNVSDHLSSSAFMSLAARFPIRSIEKEETNAVGNSIVSIVPVSDEELLAFGDDDDDSSMEEVEVQGEDSSSHKPSQFDLNEKFNQLSVEEPPNIPDEDQSQQNISTQIELAIIPKTKTFSEPPQQPPPEAERNQKEEGNANTNANAPSSAEQRESEKMKLGETKKGKNGKKKSGKEIINPKMDWEFCRKLYSSRGGRNKNHMDSVDWEAFLQADVDEIADAIKARGQQNIIAGRLQQFVRQVKQDHGEIELEWLRNAPDEIVKKYLREIEGIGLKSTECVRLLALQHVAFPVDVNVGRIAIRLGWVPLQPLPISLQIHLLQEMPVLDNIQKYLWPRLQHLDPKTLYELHYQLITFGKIFCTKRSPNCKACPMKGDCRYYASARASERFYLPGSKNNKSTSTEKTSSSSSPRALEALGLPKFSYFETNSDSEYEFESCEPIIEEPSSPQHDEFPELPDMEDLFLDSRRSYSPKRKKEDCSKALNPYVGGRGPHGNDMSNELVVSKFASERVFKLKDVERLRTKHQVYVLPDNHPLVKGLYRREIDDPSPYLLAIWTSDETTNLPQNACNSQDSRALCINEKSNFPDDSLPEEASNTILGTLLIPCRTANKGSFPLNGTYFQVNEMFADYESSIQPIKVPRSLIWNLERRIAYFGTSTSTIFKDQDVQEIKDCFATGFICVRGYDRRTRIPHKLDEKFHVSTVMTGGKRNRKEEYNE